MANERWIVGVDVAQRASSRKRVLGRGAVFVAAAVGVVPACGSSPTRAVGVRTRSAARVPAPRTVIATLQDYVSASQPVAGRDGDLWFWAAGDNDARVFDVTPSGALRSFVIGTSERDRVPARTPTLAIDPSGTVWLGVDSTLRALDPASGKWTTTTPPDPTDNGAAESRRPPEIRGTHTIAALAAGPEFVAVAQDASSSLEVFDRSRSKFAQIPLPESDSADALAFFADGTLAVGVTSYSTGRTDRVALFTDPGATPRWITVRDAEVLNVAPDGALVAGAEILSRIDSDGSVTPINDPTAGNVPSYSAGGHAIGDGRVLIAGIDAIEVFDRASAKVSESFPYPIAGCGAPFLPPNVTIPTGVDTRHCPHRPTAITVDPAANRAYELVRTREGGIQVATMTTSGGA